MWVQPHGAPQTSSFSAPNVHMLENVSTGQKTCLAVDVQRQGNNPCGPSGTLMVSPPNFRDTGRPGVRVFPLHCVELLNIDIELAGIGSISLPISRTCESSLVLLRTSVSS